MDLSGLNREKVKARWRRIHESEMRYLTMHENQTAHLKARIHAYLCGDGSVSWRRERANGKLHCEIRFYPDDKSMLRSFSDAFRAVYGREPHVKKLKNHYRVAITSMTAAKDLLGDGKFSSTEWAIPDWILQNEQNSLEWLRAFFDAEAYVGRKRICVQCVNRNGLTQVEEMLKRIGIESRRYEYTRKNPNWNINYHLVITGLGNKVAFLKRVGFNHKKKLNKLKADVA